MGVLRFGLYKLREFSLTRHPYLDILGGGTAIWRIRSNGQNIYMCMYLGILYLSMLFKSNIYRIQNLNRPTTTSKPFPSLSYPTHNPPPSKSQS
jgi:hypothetical protein